MSPPTPPANVAAALLGLLAALLIAGCGDDPEGTDPGNAADAPSYERALAGTPPELAALYEPGGTLLDGGLEAYERQIDRLRGFPIVVNKWASWCGPCREEFPYLQRQAAEHLDRVAFVGIDSEDSEAAAETFLEGHPLPYPSYSDPDKEIALEIGANLGFPSTVFYDRKGEIVHVKHGVYSDEDELAADIRKYALSG